MEQPRHARSITRAPIIQQGKEDRTKKKKSTGGKKPQKSGSNNRTTDCNGKHEVGPDERKNPTDIKPHYRRFGDYFRHRMDIGRRWLALCPRSQRPPN